MTKTPCRCFINKIWKHKLYFQVLNPETLLNSFIISNSFCVCVIFRVFQILLWVSHLVQWSRIDCQCRRHKETQVDHWVWKIPWRRKWQPIPVFLPETFHGQRSTVGYSLWGHKESNISEHKYTYTPTHIKTMSSGHRDSINLASEKQDTQEELKQEGKGLIQ